jgi:hypothetical protein
MLRRNVLAGVFGLVFAPVIASAADLGQTKDMCIKESETCVPGGTPCCGGGTCDGPGYNTTCSGSGPVDATLPDGAACHESATCVGGKCEGGSCCTSYGDPCTASSHCCGHFSCGENGLCPE